MINQTFFQQEPYLRILFGDISKSPEWNTPLEELPYIVQHALEYSQLFHVVVCLPAYFGIGMARRMYLKSRDTIDTFFLSAPSPPRCAFSQLFCIHAISGPGWHSQIIAKKVRLRLAIPIKAANCFNVILRLCCIHQKLHECTRSVFCILYRMCFAKYPSQQRRYQEIIY